MIIHTKSSVRMESVEKFLSIPIVETSVNVGLAVYSRVKNSNRLINWSCNVSENLGAAIFESVKSSQLLTVVQGPLHTLDNYGEHLK